MSGLSSWRDTPVAFSIAMTYCGGTEHLLFHILTLLALTPSISPRAKELPAASIAFCIVMDAVFMPAIITDATGGCTVYLKGIFWIRVQWEALKMEAINMSNAELRKAASENMNFDIAVEIMIRGGFNEGLREAAWLEYYYEMLHEEQLLMQQEQTEAA